MRKLNWHKFYCFHMIPIFLGPRICIFPPGVRYLMCLYLITVYENQKIERKRLEIFLQLLPAVYSSFFPNNQTFVCTQHLSNQMISGIPLSPFFELYNRCSECMLFLDLVVRFWKNLHISSVSFMHEATDILICRFEELFQL